MVYDTYYICIYIHALVVVSYNIVPFGTAYLEHALAMTASQYCGLLCKDHNVYLLGAIWEYHWPLPMKLPHMGVIMLDLQHKKAHHAKQLSTLVATVQWL